MIPKKIFTIWLNENKEIPALESKCIESQKIDGYEHKLITLDNCFKESRYIKECLDAKNWVKAADFLKIYYLYIDGGIYLDADVEVLTNFDDLLSDRLFMGKEESIGFFSNAIIGAEAGHPTLGEYLNKVEQNFRGDGDLVFEAGMRLWTDVVTWAQNKDLGIKIYPQEYFMPFDNITKQENITSNSRTKHYFSSSWLPSNLQIIP